MYLLLLSGGPPGDNCVTRDEDYGKTWWAKTLLYVRQQASNTSISKIRVVLKEDQKTAARILLSSKPLGEGYAVYRGAIAVLSPNPLAHSKRSIHTRGGRFIPSTTL